MKLSCLSESDQEWQRLALELVNKITEHLRTTKDHNEPVGENFKVGDVPIRLNIAGLGEHPDKDRFLRGAAFKVGGNLLGRKGISVNFVYDPGSLAEVPDLRKSILYTIYHELAHEEDPANILTVVGPEEDYHLRSSEIRADAAAIKRLGIKKWDELSIVAPYLPVNDRRWRKAIMQQLGSGHS